MEFVNNSKAMDVETKCTKRDSGNNNDLAKPNLLITPKKKLNLDVDSLDGVSTVDLQTLLNQRLQRSRSTSKSIPNSSISASKQNKSDKHSNSPNSISSTPERIKIENATSGKRFDATWTTPGGQSIQFNFMSKNIPTTPEIIKRNSTNFPAKKYDAVWHNTSPWKPRRASPLRKNNRFISYDNNMQNNVNASSSPYQLQFNDNSSNEALAFNNNNNSNGSLQFNSVNVQQHYHMNMNGATHQNLYVNHHGMDNATVFDGNDNQQHQFNTWNNSQ
jgi:hypothetical protein